MIKIGNKEKLRALNLFDEKPAVKPTEPNANGSNSAEPNKNTDEEKRALEAQTEGVITTEGINALTKFMNALGLSKKGDDDEKHEPEKNVDPEKQVEPEKPKSDDLTGLKSDVDTLKDLQMDNQLLKLGVTEDGLDFVKFQISTGKITTDKLNDYLSKNQHLLKSEIVSPNPKNTEKKIVASESSTMKNLKERGIL